MRNSWAYISGLQHPQVLRVMIVFCLMTCSSPAFADGITGFLEYNYSASTTNTKDSAGTNTNTKYDSLLQRYSLSVDRTLYPMLKISLGSLFEKTMSTISTDNNNLDSTTTKFMPRGEITLGNLFYSGSLGYNRRETRSTSGGISSPASISENYNARLSLRPEGLPPLDITATTSNIYDQTRKLQDQTNQFYSWSSRYTPLKDLDLNYNGQFTDSLDKLTNFESQTTSNNGRLAYSRQFFDNRVAINTNYNISMQQTKTITPSALGSILLRMPLTPSGLFIVDTTGATIASPHTITLLPETLLTDGSTSIPVAQQDQFKIGAFAPQTVDITKYLDFGLDLSIASRINTIYVTINQQLDNAVANQFTWQIFTSNDNSTWQLLTAAAIATFRPFGNGTTLDNSFELTFPEVTKRYIKIVIKPPVINFGVRTLPSVDDRIYITEITPFLSTPVANIKNGMSTSLSQLLGFNSRVRLFNKPDVYYDFTGNYAQSKNDSFSTSRYSYTNAINVNHRFDNVYSGSARFLREDSQELNAKRVTYLYSATLVAVPLPTLSNTVSYSGKLEQAPEGGTNTNNSIFFSSVAALYKGVDLGLSGGYSTATSNTGQSTTSLTFRLGSTIVPNQQLSINLGYSGSKNTQSGSTATNPSTLSQRGDLSIAYTPLQNLYFFGSWAMEMQTAKPTTISQSLGGSWGILRDGSLQLNCSYTESSYTVANEKNKTFIPSLRWNIRPGTFLDLSYILTLFKSDTQSSDTQSISASLRISF